MINNKDNREFAVIETDGRQFKVKPGISIILHRITQSPKEAIIFNKVLVSSLDINPANLVVTGEVVGHCRGDKIRIIKFKRRKHHLKRRGFKSSLTEVKITSITKIGQ
jgi:large subunit ribosomal protein L21